MAKTTYTNKFRNVRCLWQEKFRSQKARQEESRTVVTAANIGSFVFSAVSSIIAIADSVSDDRRERSKVYHLLKFVRASVRDFPDNEDAKIIDTLGSYASKIKRFTNGKISRTAIVKRNDDNEIGEIVPLPITNAHGAVIHLIRQNLRVRNRENYSAVHKIADLYMHRFFEYSDYVDNHPNIEDWEFKQTLLTAFCSEIGLHIGWLEKAMRFEEIPYDDIIV